MKYTKHFIEFLLEYNNLEEMTNDVVYKRLSEDIDKALVEIYGEDSTPPSFFRVDKSDLKQQADTLKNHLISKFDYKPKVFSEYFKKYAKKIIGDSYYSDNGVKDVFIYDYINQHLTKEDKADMLGGFAADTDTEKMYILRYEDFDNYYVKEFILNSYETIEEFIADAIFTQSESGEESFEVIFNYISHTKERNDLIKLINTKLKIDIEKDFIFLYNNKTDYGKLSLSMVNKKSGDLGFKKIDYDHKKLYKDFKKNKSIDVFGDPNMFIITLNEEDVLDNLVTDQKLYNLLFDYLSNSSKNKIAKRQDINKDLDYF